MRTAIFILLSLLLVRDVALCDQTDPLNSEEFAEALVQEAVDFKLVEMDAPHKFSKLFVSVRNRDKLRWNGIRVVFQFPSGREYQASGAKFLEAGKQTNFSLTDSQLEEANGELLAAGSNYNVPKVFVYHRVKVSSQD